MSAHLDRRQFLTRGLLGRVAALVASPLAGAPVEAAAAAPPPGDGAVSAGDLRRMTRDEVRGALRRIRARWRAR
jgi:hypothetical protein